MGRVNVPRIGLSIPSHFSIHRLANVPALRRAGAEPVVLTPASNLRAIPNLLDSIDALTLSGGGDVDPRLFGGIPDLARGIDRRRDDFEIGLLQGALERHMPILAICRGSQILNVAHGGSIRDLRQNPAVAVLHRWRFRQRAGHLVAVSPGSRLEGVIGAGEHPVNSLHSQALDRLGHHLSICATTAHDEVEAVERSDREFVIGVQWHPELAALIDLRALRLFTGLVRAAAAYRKS